MVDDSCRHPLVLVKHCRDACVSFKEDKTFYHRSSSDERLQPLWLLEPGVFRNVFLDVKHHPPFWCTGEHERRGNVLSHDLIAKVKSDGGRGPDFDGWGGTVHGVALGMLDLGLSTVLHAR